MEESTAKSDSKQNPISNLHATNRKHEIDKMFFSDKKQAGLYFIENAQYINHLFLRAVATKFLFKNIDFSKTIFENCYLKDCRFENCRFEGAKFMNCNLKGSYFEYCKFDYAVFEKTFVDVEIFECAPIHDNLKFRFARSLKLNYASIGDYINSSKAVMIELQATERHLKNTWLSGDEWYKKKYGGIQRRCNQFRKWVKVCLLDFIWGNGESLWRLFRLNFILFFILTIYDFTKNPDKYNILEFVYTMMVKVPSYYMGIKVVDNQGEDYFGYYPLWLSFFLVFTRLVCFGLFMSIIIKKYNRR